MRWIKTILSVLTLAASLVLAPAAMAAGNEPGIQAEPVVNINQAGADELAEALTGVGEKKAQAIVQYREQHGNFGSSSALTQVKGIGNATVSKNQDRIRLE